MLYMGINVINEKLGVNFYAPRIKRTPTLNGEKEVCYENKLCKKLC